MPRLVPQLTTRTAWLNIGGDQVSLSPIETTIIRRLLAGPATIRELVRVVYEPLEDGGALGADRAISTHVCQINTKLLHTAAWIATGTEQGYELRVRPEAHSAIGDTECSKAGRPSSSTP